MSRQVKAARDSKEKFNDSQVDILGEPYNFVNFRATPHRFDEISPPRTTRARLAAKNGAESVEKRFEGANPTSASLSFTDHREVDVLVV